MKLTIITANKHNWRRYSWLNNLWAHYVTVVKAVHDDIDASVSERLKDSNYYFIVIFIRTRIWMIFSATDTS